MRRFRWDKKYLYWGVTAFFVLAACIVFYMLVSNLGWLGDTLRTIGDVLSPFIWGLVIAYLFSPLMKVYSRWLFTPLCSLLIKRKKERIPGLARGLSVFLCIITLFVLVGGLIWLVVPQLYTSIETVVMKSGEYIDNADAFINRTLADYPELASRLNDVIGDVSNGITKWATDQLLPRMSTLLSSLTANVMNVLKGIYNIIIGVIVSVYVLYSKESFCAHAKKIVYCIFSVEAAEKLLHGVQFTNRVFMGFISGKILDSFIIGLICFVGCAIMQMPYVLLVSVIIGVTNIIPFFGPFIGAVPSALFILTESPLKMVMFVVFIVLLQQFDGNILGPKILGNSVGVNGFWILFSIIIGAGMFGFAGMLLGVPVFVVLYTLIKSIVERKLRRSGLPVETASYTGIGYFDPHTGQAVPWPEEVTHGKSHKKSGSSSVKEQEKPNPKDDGPKA